jgi:ABC-type bacteriocin/lantibiotic exporter with double-glycine peptidase domain
MAINSCSLVPYTTTYSTDFFARIRDISNHRKSTTTQTMKTTTMTTMTMAITAVTVLTMTAMKMLMLMLMLMLMMMMMMIMYPQMMAKTTTKTMKIPKKMMMKKTKDQNKYNKLTKKKGRINK